MSEHYVNDPLLDMFIFETTQLIEQLEQLILSSETESRYSQEAINEIFRIMHTIKGSAAMMNFNNISTLAHTMEDIFYHLREKKPKVYRFTELSDLVLVGIDFIKSEVEKIKNSIDADGDSSSLVQRMEEFLKGLKDNSNTFLATIYFEEGCEMENIRAYTVIRDLKTITEPVLYIPEDILDNDETIDIIRRDGFRILIKTEHSYEMIKDFLSQIIFLKDLELTRVSDEEAVQSFYRNKSEELTGQATEWTAEPFTHQKRK